MSIPQTPSRVALTTDLGAQGRHFGDAMLRWSDNSVPLGYHPVPVISIRGGAGPVLLLTGGTHGDEFEGPSAILRLVHQLDPAQLSGQIIAIPALNAPALAVSSRVTPLDGQNLNRAFPGDAGGGPTAMLAHFLETAILPLCDAAVDLHSGGKASFFQPCSLPTHCADADLSAQNMALARVFGLPLIWRLGAHNDARSINAAAQRVGVPMIAAELGGGGGVDPGITDATEAGLYNILRYLNMLSGEILLPPQQRVVEVASPHDSLYARGDGIFDRQICAGQDVTQGDPAGWFHYVGEPERASVALHMPQDGVILAHTNRGMVRRGDLLALVVRDVDQDL
ncbi:succinylglutamate desuccinylase/aspartoacylase family protein [Puniceibacterium sp. IMCC21224]|uniref:succinylglutamate desuccinylase/aspartoacylase family protein n=1 Tax=Puniceibacterium sp. IMCC21224 TaxID=1618204 RepID=UPI00065D4B17|nr:succinylglutamate desuccinylase/aspartoacylase family protein [Puniceibacterium sp. IMCC21224]KMK67784.1 putative deacylase [Puniceibacterium sp. IMCC21224]